MNKEHLLINVNQYKLTTLQILYYMPDYSNLLNEFTWQFLDLHPNFPRAHKFLLHWKDNVDASIREINIAHEGVLYPNQFGHISDAELITKIQ